VDTNLDPPLRKLGGSGKFNPGPLDLYPGTLTTSPDVVIRKNMRSQISIHVGVCTTTVKGVLHCKYHGMFISVRTSPC
jgi:hypothetical protein